MNLTRLLIATLGLIVPLTACSNDGDAAPTSSPAATTVAPTTAAATTVPRPTSETLPVPSTTTATTAATILATTLPTVTVPEGAPPLVLYGEDLDAVARSMIEFKFWTDQNPAEGLDSLSMWVSPESPYEEQVRPNLESRAQRGARATGTPEILEIRTESVDPPFATVLVWSRSEPYQLIDASGVVNDVPGYERTLSVLDLTQETDGRWAVYDLRVPQQG